MLLPRSSIFLFPAVGLCFVSAVFNDSQFSEWPSGKSDGIAYIGGGFRAEAACAGFHAGMAALGYPPERLLKDTKAMGCNSGGCWFIARFVWSRKYHSMLARMAQGYASGKAAAEYMAGIMLPLLQQHKTKPTGHPTRLACCREKKGPPCGTGLLELPNYVHYDGKAYCCPNSMLGSCARSRFFPCDSTLQTHYFGDTMYCCQNDTFINQFNEGNSCNRRLEAGMMKDLLQWTDVVWWYLLHTQTDWQDFIRRFMEVTGDVDTRMPLSATPVEAFEGKELFISATIMTPTTEKTGPMLLGVTKANIGSQTKYFTSELTPAAAEMLNNWTCIGQLCGTMVPAVFSVKLGRRHSTVLPFVSEETRDTLHMEYKMHARSFWSPFGWSEVAKGSSSSNLTAFAETSEAPISVAVAISSAVAAQSSLMLRNNVGWLQRGLPVWLQRRLLALPVAVKANTPSLDQSNFDTAKAQMLDNNASTDKFDYLTNEHIMALHDGGTTDNIGMAAMIAANHTSLFIVYNAANFTPDNYVAFTTFHQYVSGISSVTDAAAFPVFNETMYDVREQMLKYWTQVKAVDHAQELESIWYGPLYLHTVDCPAYGIRGGQLVTIRIVLPNAYVLGCCSFTSEPYALYASEVLETIVANPAVGEQFAAWL